MIVNTLYASLATLGFGILFNIKGKKLIIATFGGGLSWFSYLFFTHLHVSGVLSYFIAALVCSIFSETMARICKTPVTTFIVCGIITLVPGGGMYNTMLEFTRGNANLGISKCLETISIAGAIAVGIALVSSLTKLIFKGMDNRKIKKDFN
jgi:uncharacterized membrane protein YjjB (DUF3815 family)